MKISGGTLDRVRRAAFILGLFVIGLVALRLSLVLVSTQMFHTSLLYFGDDGLVARFAGTAPRPYAYRVLTDWLLRGVMAIGLPHLSIPLLDPIVKVAQSSQHAIPAASFEQIKAYAIVATLLAFAFLAFVFQAARCVLGSYVWAIFATLLAIVVVNAIQLQGFSQPYDFTTLFFSSLLFWMIVRNDEELFSASFPLACLAKESLILLVIASTFSAYKRKPHRVILRHLAFRTMTFLIIYGWERAAFAANTGAPMYHNVPGHVRELVEHVDIYTLCSMIFVLALPFFGLPFKHPALKGGLCVLPILAGLYVWGGNPGEFRIIFEVLPIVIIAGTDSLQRLVVGPWGDGSTNSGGKMWG